MAGDLDDDTTSVDAEQGNGMPPPSSPSTTPKASYEVGHTEPYHPALKTLRLVY